MNRFLLVCISAAFVLNLMGNPVFAQGLEVGAGVGGSFATGDVTRGFEVGEMGFAGQVFVRYNLSNVVSVRGSGVIASLKGDDETNPTDAFAEARGFEFHRTNYEASMLIEYNFLDYKERKSIVNWSPYFFAGAGLTASSNRRAGDEYSRIQPVVPFGLGLKYRLTKQWNLEYEFGARKTFYDGVDRISEPPALNKLDIRYGNELDNDWYFFTAISVSYTFYSIPCPFNSY